MASSDEELFHSGTELQTIKQKQFIFEQQQMLALAFSG